MTAETTSKMPAGTLCPHAFNSLAELNAMKHSTILKQFYELAHMCAHVCLYVDVWLHIQDVIHGCHIE